jgi:hypothetical protein
VVRRKETTQARERPESDAGLGITAGALPLSRRGRGTRGTPALKAPASNSPGLGAISIDRSKEVNVGSED